MKIKVKDIYNLKEGLETINEKEFPVKVAYRLQKISMKVEEEYKVASDLRSKLIEKYKSETLENGNVLIKTDKIDIFNDEVKELMDQNVVIDLDTIKLTDLGDKIKPATLIQLDKIIKEGK